MKKNIIINCPECYARKFHVIARKRGFSWDKAATGAIIGGTIGGHGLIKRESPLSSYDMKLPAITFRTMNNNISSHGWPPS